MTWLRRLLQRDRAERQLDAELRDHLERLTADYQRVASANRKRAEGTAGVRRARAGQGRLPGRPRHPLARRNRPGPALRIPAAPAEPAFTFVAVASLALGLAPTARSSRSSTASLKSLPVRDPQRLILLDDGSWTNPIWEQIRARHSEISDGAAAWVTCASICRAPGPPNSWKACGRAATSSTSLVCRPCSVARSRWLTTTVAAGRMGRSR